MSEQPKPADKDRVEEAVQAGDYRQYVTFLVGDRLYGVEITLVREIKQWSPTTALPNQPHYTRGVLNLRGTIVPVHDLRVRFGGAQTEATENHVVVIASIGEQSVGILVDAVSDILTVAPDDVRPIPSGARELDLESISGLVTSDDQMIALLDLPRLFPNEDMMAA
ncbi:MAG: chemotaxis protein CheW [Neomegalonema sp.]|nr:chemotaxis protein CheW [Neomegalonema sp.]